MIAPLPYPEPMDHQNMSYASRLPKTLFYMWVPMHSFCAFIHTRMYLHLFLPVSFLCVLFHNPLVQ